MGIKVQTKTLAMRLFPDVKGYCLTVGKQLRCILQLLDVNKYLNSQMHMYLIRMCFTGGSSQPALPSAFLDASDTSLRTVQEASHHGDLPLQHKLSPPEPQFGYFVKGQDDPTTKQHQHSQYIPQHPTGQAFI